MALLGYARVSTRDQDAALQHDALEAAGCEKIFTDYASGVSADRPELARLWEYARPGDVVVVWRLDRLGRSLKHLTEQVEEMADAGVELRSLHESIDTTTPGGRLVFHLFSALAQFERDLIVERTRAGLAAARARGRTGGRPPKFSAEKRQMIVEMYRQHGYSAVQIAQMVQAHPSTIYRVIRAAEQAD